MQPDQRDLDKQRLLDIQEERQARQHIEQCIQELQQLVRSVFDQETPVADNDARDCPDLPAEGRSSPADCQHAAAPPRQVTSSSGRDAARTLPSNVFTQPSAAAHTALQQRHQHACRATSSTSQLPASAPSPSALQAPPAATSARPVQQGPRPRSSSSQGCPRVAAAAASPPIPVSLQPRAISPASSQLPPGLQQLTQQAQQAPATGPPEPSGALGMAEAPAASGLPHPAVTSCWPGRPHQLPDQPYLPAAPLPPVVSSSSGIPPQPHAPSSASGALLSPHHPQAGRSSPWSASSTSIPCQPPASATATSTTRIAAASNSEYNASFSHTRTTHPPTYSSHHPGSTACSVCSAAAASTSATTTTTTSSSNNRYAASTCASTASSISSLVLQEAALLRSLHTQQLLRASLEPGTSLPQHEGSSGPQWERPPVAGCHPQQLLPDDSSSLSRVSQRAQPHLQPQDTHCLEARGVPACNPGGEGLQQHHSRPRFQPEAAGGPLGTHAPAAASRRLNVWCGSIHQQEQLLPHEANDHLFTAGTAASAGHLAADPDTAAALGEQTEPGTGAAASGPPRGAAGGAVSGSSLVWGVEGAPSGAAGTAATIVDWQPPAEGEAGAPGFPLEAGEGQLPVQPVLPVHRTASPEWDPAWDAVVEDLLAGMAAAGHTATQLEPVGAADRAEPGVWASGVKAEGGVSAKGVDVPSSAHLSSAHTACLSRAALSGGLAGAPLHMAGAAAPQQRLQPNSGSSSSRCSAGGSMLEQGVPSFTAQPAQQVAGASAAAVSSQHLAPALPRSHDPHQSTPSLSCYAAAAAVMPMGESSWPVGELCPTVAATPERFTAPLAAPQQLGSCRSSQLGTPSAWSQTEASASRAASECAGCVAAQQQLQELQGRLEEAEFEATLLQAQLLVVTRERTAQLQQVARPGQ